MAEAFKTGRLDACFFIAPLAMKLREQGVPTKIVYLGHRDGSEVMVRKEDPAKSLRDLKGKTFAIPSKFSNQYLVVRKLMEEQGMAPDDLRFVEMAPPDMPGALGAGAIDAYFVGEPFAAKAELDGTGRWTLRPEGAGTHVRYDWMIDVTTPWQVALAPILRPLFAWNHGVVMGWGYTDLKTRLGEPV